LSDYLRVQWQQHLGINLPKAELIDPSTLPDHFHNEARPVMFISGWVADYPDPENFFGRAINYYKMDRWEKTYVQLLSQAKQVTDQVTRQKLYRQADKILIDQAAIIPLGYGRGHMLIKPWVKRYPTSPVNWAFWKDVVIEPH
jgi:ABC-type transport system substrate-binding protein